MTVDITVPFLSRYGFNEVENIVLFLERQGLLSEDETTDFIEE